MFNSRAFRRNSVRLLLATLVLGGVATPPHTVSGANIVPQRPDLDVEAAVSFIHVKRYGYPPTVDFDVLKMEQKLKQLNSDSGIDNANGDVQDQLYGLLRPLVVDDGELARATYGLLPAASRKSPKALSVYAARYPETDTGLKSAIRVLRLASEQESFSGKDWEGIQAMLTSYPLLAHEAGVEMLRQMLIEILQKKGSEKERAKEVFILIEKHIEQSYGLVMFEPLTQAANQLLLEHYKNQKAESAYKELGPLVADELEAWNAAAKTIETYSPYPPLKPNAGTRGGRTAPVAVYGELVATTARLRAISHVLKNADALRQHPQASELRRELQFFYALNTYFGWIIGRIDRLEEHLDRRFDKVQEQIEQNREYLLAIRENVERLQDAVERVESRQKTMIQTLGRIEGNTKEMIESLDKIELQLDEVHTVMTVNPEGGTMICGETGIPVTFPLHGKHSEKQGDTTATTKAKLSWTGQGPGLLEVHVWVEKTGISGKGYATGFAAILDGQGNTLFDTRQLEEDRFVKKHAGSVLFRRVAKKGPESKFYEIPEDKVRRASFLAVGAKPTDTWGGPETLEEWIELYEDVQAFLTPIPKEDRKEIIKEGIKLIPILLAGA